MRLPLLYTLAQNCKATVAASDGVIIRCRGDVVFNAVRRTVGWERVDGLLGLAGVVMHRPEGST